MNGLKKYLIVTAIVFASIAVAEDIPGTLLMDGAVLLKTSQSLAAGNIQLKPALDQLIKDADAALELGPFSVMDKTKLPPSGDKHDYASYARYWWPDPTKPNGLPYIRRDGDTNPDSQSPAESDRSALENLCIKTEVLALAWYLTGEDQYAEKAAQLLRTWFLNPETRMNPNLKFAQGIPGKSAGTKSGVLDGRLLIRALDGALLVSDSSALSAEELKALRVWAGQYLNWLQTGSLARQADAATNNHGTFFDVQVMYFSLFSGHPEVTKQLAKSALQKRIVSQVNEFGVMPEEITRTRSLHYSIFNLQAMFLIARLAEQVDVDLWHAGDARIKAALDFLAPYADPAKHWPRNDVEEADRVRLLPILLQAADVFQDDTYLQLIEKLPLSERADQRANLVVPLMR